jgi:DMSO/TMAO reductase YedYZ molybdopterin-dependent catalytic subunit
MGRATGIALAVCFLTGLVSHLHQHPPGWLDVPSRPVWGYQLTQGVHVATGIALIPLVLAKLWVVYPRLFVWPPVRTLGHGLERLLIVPLVAGVLFQLTTGLLNIVQWYPWGFFFPAAHWAMAWVVIGALLIHVAVKLPLHAGRPGPDEQDGAQELSRDRRALLIGVASAAGAVTLASVGQTIAPLSGISLLAPRRAGSGPQGVPINRTAVAAGVTGRARDPLWRLQVRAASGRGAGRLLTVGLAELDALPQHTSTLPIACVEGWSTTAAWSGVRLRDLLDLASIPADSHLRAISLETAGLYATSPIGPSAARDPLTLLALRLNGAPLTLDHGYPARLIAPDRPGVQQTKWLSAIEVVPA